MARESQLFLQAHVAIYTSERTAHASKITETEVIMRGGSNIGGTRALVFWKDYISQIQ